MALSNEEIIRLELSDVEPPYMLSSDQIEYFLTKNNQSVHRTLLDCAKTLLLQLSMRSDETVDIFTVKAGRTASEFRESLKLFLRESQLNGGISAKGYFGGISKQDMLDNNSNPDNNTVVKLNSPAKPSSSFFEYK